MGEAVGVPQINGPPVAVAPPPAVVAPVIVAPRPYVVAPVYPVYPRYGYGYWRR